MLLSIEPDLWLSTASGEGRTQKFVPDIDDQGSRPWELKGDGHLGCSQGYNSMEYKADQIEGFYTQGQEQTHSLLQKVESSFCQMNYQSFMIMLRMFFRFRNLKNQKIL